MYILCKNFDGNFSLSHNYIRFSRPSAKPNKLEVASFSDVVTLVANGLNVIGAVRHKPQAWRVAKCRRVRIRRYTQTHVRCVSLVGNAPPANGVR